MTELLRLADIRVAIPERMILHRGFAGKFFRFLPNSQGLNEEYLYSHQPISRRKLPVYSTSAQPIGYLDDSEETRGKFNVLTKPAIVVARKGYAGRMFVVEDEKFIVHEDGYGIRPKTRYADSINPYWFVGHYSAEFQSYRTSDYGIGDFPRRRFGKMKIIIPRMDLQNKIAILYKRREELLRQSDELKNKATKITNTIIQRNIPS